MKQRQQHQQNTKEGGSKSIFADKAETTVAARVPLEEVKTVATEQAKEEASAAAAAESAQGEASAASAAMRLAPAAAAQEMNEKMSTECTHGTVEATVGTGCCAIRCFFFFKKKKTAVSVASNGAGFVVMLHHLVPARIPYKSREKTCFLE